MATHAGTGSSGWGMITRGGVADSQQKRADRSGDGQGKHLIREIEHSAMFEYFANSTDRMAAAMPGGVELQ